MKSPHHDRVRRPSAAPAVSIHEPYDDRGPFVDRPCFVRNPRLGSRGSDRRCEHCLHYLTPRCHHLEDFLDDVDDLSPE